MANISGPQPDIKYCPACRAEIRNVPRSEMKYRVSSRKDDTVPPYTHTYKCPQCGKKFEINQDR